MGTRLAAGDEYPGTDRDTIVIKRGQQCLLLVILSVLMAL